MAEFAVVLRFDPITEGTFKYRQETLWLQGLGPEPEVPYSSPHITLAGLEGITPVELAEQLQAFAQDEVGFTVDLDAVGIFPGSEEAVYIAPAITSELMGFTK
jgi:2'-5' RNA ligase